MQHRTHIQDWMTPDPCTTRSDMSLLAALDLMQRRNVRRLPVVDGQGALVGIVTRSDIQQVIPFDEEQHTDAMFALAGMTVDEIMTRGPVYVTPTQAIRDAAQSMIKYRVSGLPVVDNDRVVGIITESDIFRLVVQSWNDADD